MQFDYTVNVAKESVVLQKPTYPAAPCVHIQLSGNKDRTLTPAGGDGPEALTEEDSARAKACKLGCGLRARNRSSPPSK